MMVHGCEVAELYSFAVGIVLGVLLELLIPIWLRANRKEKP